MSRYSNYLPEPALSLDLPTRTCPVTLLPNVANPVTQLPNPRHPRHSNFQPSPTTSPYCPALANPVELIPNPTRANPARKFPTPPDPFGYLPDRPIALALGNARVVRIRYSGNSQK